MILFLPKPPSVNALYRNLKGRGRVKTKRYLDWIGRATDELRAQNPKPIRGAFHLSIELTDRRGDCDNFIKPISDLLVSNGLVDDDRHMESARIGYGDSSENYGAKVEVTEHEKSG